MRLAFPGKGSAASKSRTPACAQSEQESAVSYQACGAFGFSEELATTPDE